MIFWNKRISFSISFCGLKSRCNGKLQQRLPCSQTHPQSGWWETRDSELLNDQIFILIAKENHLCRECSFPKQENLSCFTKQKLYMLPILWFFIRPSPCSALPEFKKSINRGWNEAGEVLRARQWLVGCEQPQMPKMHKNFTWWSRGSKVQMDIKCNPSTEIHFLSGENTIAAK